MQHKISYFEIKLSIVYFPYSIYNWNILTSCAIFSDARQKNCT